MKKIILLIMAVMIFLCGCNEKSSYNKGLKLLNEGKFEEAKDIFFKLDYYMDSYILAEKIDSLLKGGNVKSNEIITNDAYLYNGNDLDSGANKLKELKNEIKNIEEKNKWLLYKNFIIRKEGLNGFDVSDYVTEVSFDIYIKNGKDLFIRFEGKIDVPEKLKHTTAFDFVARKKNIDGVIPINSFRNINKEYNLASGNGYVHYSLILNVEEKKIFLKMGSETFELKSDK